MGDNLDVDPQVLVQAAEGINGIIGELSDLGVKETGASGRGFSLVALSPMQAGRQNVQAALERFAERWSWGVRHLVQAGNEIAKVLGLAAGRYHMMDQAASDTMKQMWTHLVGNPHLSGDEIKARSWQDTLADNGINHIRNADYSGASLDEAMTKIGTNVQVVQAVGPQALANLGSYGTGAQAGWNTGAAQQAAAITQPGEGS
ncbi:type VII secretion target [Nocardia amamiensis]|uniref:type VII secretion target n=1 Tax=Nocardia amamiensis TaxID=404578 RepID=UPI0033F71305